MGHRLAMLGNHSLELRLNPDRSNLLIGAEVTRMDKELRRSKALTLYNVYHVALWSYKEAVRLLPSEAM